MRLGALPSGTLLDAFGLVASTELSGNTYAGIGAYGSTHAFDDFAVWPASVPVPDAFGPPPAIPTGTGDPLLTRDFTATDGTPLTEYDPGVQTTGQAWEIRNNRARMTTAGVNGTATWSTATADHEISASITVPDSTPRYPVDWFAGLFARYTNGGNYVHARLLYQNDSPEVEIWSRIDGEVEGGGLIGYINLGSGALKPGSTHTLTLAVAGDEVAASLNGELVVQACTALAGGTRAGIGVADNEPEGQPSWDDVKVRAASLIG